jgi:hypothetical protein
MTALAVFFVALSAALFAVPAISYAQPYIGGGIGTHNTRPATIPDEDFVTVRKAAHRFGICAAARHQKLAEQAVEHPFGPGLTDALRKVATNDCLRDGALDFSPVLLRSELFEALYAIKFGRGPSRDLSSANPIDFAKWYPQPLTQYAANLMDFVKLGACASRQKQVTAWKLVMSEPGSGAEVEAISELQSVLPGCLPKGQTFKVTIDMLRGGVAEALYRLSESAPIVAAAHQ